MIPKRILINATKVAIILLVLFLACSGCLSGSAKDIVVEEISTQEFTKTISGVGKLEPLDACYVHPGATGPLATVNVKDGDHVEAGQVLASVDRGVLEEAVKKAESNYLTQSSMGDIFASLFSEMQSLYGLVNSSLDSLQYYTSSVGTLAEGYSEELKTIIDELPPEERERVQEFVSEVEEEYNRLIAQAPAIPRVSSSGYPSSASQADAARSEVAYADYQKALDGLNNADIIAPISGTAFYVTSGGLVPEDLISNLKSNVGGFTSSLKFIGGGVEEMFEDVLIDFVLPELELKPGSQVRSDEPAFMIVDLNKALIKLRVEEIDIPLVEVGQRVDVNLDALPGKQYEGTVTHVARRASMTISDSSLYEVTVELDRCDAELRLGYTANADIRVVEKEDAILLPLEAVRMDPHPHVFVVRDGIAHEREVVLGMEDEDMVEVLEGLKDREQVIVKGASEIEEGSKI